VAKKSTARRGREQKAIEANVYALPSSFRKARSPEGNRVVQILDAYGLGMASISNVLQTPSPAPKVRNLDTGKRKKNGYLAYTGPYTGEEVIKLARVNTKLGEQFIAFAFGYALSGSTSPKVQAALKKFAGYRFLPQVVAVVHDVVVVQNSASSISTLAFGSGSEGISKAAQTLAEQSDATKLHPIDYLDLFTVLASATAQGFTSDTAKRIRSVAAATSLGSDVTSMPNRVAALHQSVGSLSRASSSSMRSILGAVSALLKSAAPFARSLHNAKPLSSPTLRGGSMAKDAYGFEVESITYQLQGTDGKDVDFVHKSASVQAEDRASDAREYVYMLNNTTPAGRLYLCWSGGALIFASDRSPSRALFNDGSTPDPATAALFNVSGNTASVVGFTF
jgi:hypothetical protein